MKKITKILSLIIMFSLALVMVACGEDPVEISFVKDSETMTVGDTLQLEYTVSDESVTLVWSADDKTIVDLDQTGFVKALKAGSVDVTVKVKDQDVSATMTITVEPVPVINPTSVVIENSVEEGKVGQSFTFSAKVLPVGSEQTVTWESSNGNVATVSNTGVVELVGIGSVFITATSTKDTTKNAEVEINVLAPDPESITITSEENVTKVNVFNTVQFSASTSPDLASDEVTWTVSDETLASIDANGKLTAKKEGTVTVTATSTVVDTVTATFELVIERPEPTEITVTGSQDILAKGEEVTLSVTVTPAIAFQTVSFSSSDANVATVDENGKIVAVAAGDVVITITSTVKDTVTATYNVKVVDTDLIAYTTDVILLDSSLTAKRFEKVTVDSKDYYMGLNAFTSAALAFAALEENSTLKAMAGTYAEAVAIKANGVKVLGPNEGKAAGQDLSNRVAEAVFTKIITLDGVQDILFDGIAITGSAQIRSVKPVKNITVQNLNSYSPSVPSGEGVIFALANTGTEVNENYIIRYSRLVDTFGGGPAGGYRGIRINNAKDIEISNNYLVGFYDTIRLEGEVSSGADKGTGASGNIVIRDNVFENNFQYSIWIGTYHSANVEIKDNYIGSREAYSGVYGHIYVVGHKAKDGVKSIVNVTGNEMPYNVAGWHQFRFNSQGSTPEQLEINVNYNIFHQVAGSDSEGQYTHIADHYKDPSTFVINGANNYYLYEGEVKADYFLRTTFEPALRELSDELKIKQMKKEIPAVILDDYTLPTLEGLTWSLKAGEDATIYDVETGKLLKLVGENAQVVVIATLNSVDYEITLHFGIADTRLTQVYYNSNKTGGTFDTQTTTAGFGGFSIIVNGKQFFLGKDAYIPVSSTTENQVLSVTELRPNGSGAEGDDFYNVSLVKGVATDYAGYATVYQNTGDVAVKFDLSHTYGRNNSAYYGYGKVVFVPQADGTFKVSAALPNTGDNTTSTTTNETMFTLNPGEILLCPHTWDTGGSGLIAPTENKPNGILIEGTIVRILQFKNVFEAAE